MFKRDKIAIGAAGIIILSVTLFVITQNQMWLTMMIASYLLRPTLGSLGVAKRLIDERQMTIHYRSGNIAFAAMMIAAVVIAALQYSKDDHSWELFAIVIVVGLATKALFNVILVNFSKSTGSKIIIGVGIMVTLFVSLENGFSFGTVIEGLPGLVIIALGLLANKYPRTIGTLVFAVATILLVLVLSKGITLAQIATALLVCSPLAIAGACLFARDDDDAENVDSGPSLLAP